MEKFIILAGEEGGPVSNKLGGIWNVIDAEAKTLTELAKKGEIDEEIKVIVVGPYFGYVGADWNVGRNRVTSLEGLEPVDDNTIVNVIKALGKIGIKTFQGVKTLENGAKITYILFDTRSFDNITAEFMGKSMSLTNKVKGEAWILLGLDSLSFEKEPYGQEYTHYLNLSYGISEFVRLLATRDSDEFVPVFCVIPSDDEIQCTLEAERKVSLHCHEFGVFYALARIKRLGMPVRTVATFHATIPGRASGYKTIEKIKKNDSTFEPWTPIGLTKLESLAKYADVITFVGDSTRKEANLFYGIDGVIVRNGIYIEDEIEFKKKDELREKIQNLIADKLSRLSINIDADPKKIIPIYTISRTEIENKGYPDLLDALVMLEHIIKYRILGGTLDNDILIVCFLITAHGPKDVKKLPETFPFEIPDELLIGDEIRLKKMITERKLCCEDIFREKRKVISVFYPQWLSENDGGFNMKMEDVFAGCVAGIFPSRYDPFLLTGLEAGKVGTPFIVSRICGLSDALRNIKRKVSGIGGVVIVDNIDQKREESVIEYALGMEYFISTYLTDKVKYELICSEALDLAKSMNWEEPVKQYYEMLSW